ncbi:hypothetical protein ACJZ2D_004581 [Fusarium nematophilum]
MDADRTISALARECSSIFADLLTLDLEYRDEGNIEDKVEDSRGKFNVWASNIGALQPPWSKKSLDSRLKDAPLMRSSVISGLERLKRSTTRISNILSGRLPNRRTEEYPPQGTDPKAGADEFPTSELQQLLLNLSSSLNHLFGLSVLIRRMRPKGRIRGLDDAPENPRDVVTVTDKFPRVRQRTWLAQRLGNAIGQRRQYFEYRQQHRQRLASHGSEKNISLDDGEPGVDAATTIATTFEENLDGEPSAARQLLLDRRSIFTAATSLVSDYDENQEMGRRIPDIPDMVLDGLQLDYGIPVECPYCRTIQTFANRLEWKRHVFSDLQPYVCTFQKCGAGLFATRHEWLKHELDNHRRRWQCIRCHNSDTVFSTEADMLAHLRRKHAGTITENQAGILLKACEQPVIKFDSSACPLCTEWNPPSTDKSNAKEFFRHLAKHQQQISLEALPLYLEGLEIRDPEISDASDQSSRDSEEEEEEEQEDVAASKRLFRVPLQELYARDGLAVPMLVYQCIQAVDLYGLGIESIYATHGSAAVIRTLRQKFEMDSRDVTLDFRNPENFSHDIAATTDLLKQFFRELPEPLMTREDHNRFVEAVKHDDKLVRRDKVHAVVNGLPDVNYASLRAMVLHLHRVMDNSDTNGMTSRKLAQVFGPIFMHVDPADPTSDTSQVQIVDTILQHTLDIFDED